MTFGRMVSEEDSATCDNIVTTSAAAAAAATIVAGHLTESDFVAAGKELATSDPQWRWYDISARRGPTGYLVRENVVLPHQAYTKEQAKIRRGGGGGGGEEGKEGGEGGDITNADNTTAAGTVSATKVTTKSQLTVSQKKEVVEGEKGGGEELKDLQQQIATTMVVMSDEEKEGEEDEAAIDYQDVHSDSDYIGGKVAVLPTAATKSTTTTAVEPSLKQQRDRLWVSRSFHIVYSTSYRVPCLFFTADWLGKYEKPCQASDNASSLTRYVI